MVMPARGVTHTIVNGHVAYADGAVTGATSGMVLRS